MLASGFFAGYASRACFSWNMDMLARPVKHLPDNAAEAWSKVFTAFDNDMVTVMLYR